jgi:uncharacterized protein (DUF1330 family)
MSAYVVAQLRFTDEAAYRRYQRRFADALAGSGGKLLAADEAPIVLEGKWVGDKLVIMEFENGTPIPAKPRLSGDIRRSQGRC